MKSFHNTVITMIGVFVLLTATLLVLRTGVLNTPKALKSWESAKQHTVMRNFRKPN